MSLKIKLQKLWYKSIFHQPIFLFEWIFIWKRPKHSKTKHSIDRLYDHGYCSKFSYDLICKYWLSEEDENIEKFNLEYESVKERLRKDREKIEGRY